MFFFTFYRKKSPNQIRIQSKWVRAKKKIVRKIRRMKKIEVYWIEEPNLSVQAYTVHTVIQYFAYFEIVSLSSSVSFISIVLIFSSCFWLFGCSFMFDICVCVKSFSLYSKLVGTTTANGENVPNKNAQWIYYVWIYRSIFTMRKWSENIIYLLVQQMEYKTSSQGKCDRRGRKRINNMYTYEK